MSLRDIETPFGKGGKRELDWNELGPVILTVIAIAAFLYLRLRNLDHTLTWDEARFMLINRSCVTGLANPWSAFINLHPPAYRWICAFLNNYYNGGAVSFELVSVLFSLGTLILVGHMTCSLFDRWTGALSMFFLATLPASTVLDTWIKEDAVAIFFVTLTIYLFMRKKYISSGVMLGLGMLSKEIAIFALTAVGLYALSCWRREKILGAVKVGLIGGAISFWWYLFVSDYVGHFGGFFLGNNYESQYFAHPWHYYLSGARYDFGWCILAAAVAGLAFCVRRRFQGNLVYMLPVAWLVPVYALLSFSNGKPYWMVTSMMPAAAMLAAIGAAESAKWLGRRIPSARFAHSARIILVGSLLIWAFLGALFSSYWEYNQSRGIFLQSAELARQDADLIIGSAKKEDKILVAHNMDPTLVYYLGDTNLVLGNIMAFNSPDDLASYARGIDADWLYVMPANQDVNGFLLRIDELLPVKATSPGAYHSYLLEIDKAEPR